MSRIETLIENAPFNNNHTAVIPDFIRYADKASDALRELTKDLSKKQIKGLRARFKTFANQELWDRSYDPYGNCHLACAKYIEWFIYRYDRTSSKKYKKSYWLHDDVFGHTPRPRKPEKTFGCHFDTKSPLPVAYIFLRLVILYGYIISRRATY